MIKRVYQIADTHIPTYQQLDMYATQLEKLTNAIAQDVEKHELNSDEVRIVLCGDLVHSKNIVSNELSVFASSFIRRLSAIGRLYCIAGNHDLIESNTNRKDTISALFETAQFENAWLLDMELGYESGVIADDNITWALYSFFDDFNKPDIESAKIENPDNKIVGLFHGSVIGSKLYNGFVVDFGCGKDCFSGCDCVMAGHIHKRQVLKNGDCDIVYAGSPFQQNHGESLTQHGFCVWDIETMTHEFVDLDNEYGYYSFNINSIEDIEADTLKLRNL